MSQIDTMNFNIKVVALDHARSVQARFEVVDAATLIKDAKKIEKFIRDGDTEV